MGKSTIDETSPYYGGVYVGQISHVEVKNVVESSDLVLSIGAILSDFNTVYPGFTGSNDRESLVIASKNPKRLNSIPHGRWYVEHVS